MGTNSVVGDRMVYEAAGKVHSDIQPQLVFGHAVFGEALAVEVEIGDAAIGRGVWAHEGHLAVIHRLVELRRRLHPVLLHDRDLGDRAFALERPRVGVAQPADLIHAIEVIEHQAVVAGGLPHQANRRRPLDELGEDAVERRQPLVAGPGVRPPGQEGEDFTLVGIGVMPLVEDGDDLLDVGVDLGLHVGVGDAGRGLGASEDGGAADRAARASRGGPGPAVDDGARDVGGRLLRIIVP